MEESHLQGLFLHHKKFMETSWHKKKESWPTSDMPTWQENAHRLDIFRATDSAHV